MVEIKPHPLQLVLRWKSKEACGVWLLFKRQPCFRPVHLGSRLRPRREFQLYPPRGYGFATSSMREMGHGVHIDSGNLPTSVHCARVPTLVQLVKKGPTRVPKVGKKWF